MLRHSAIKFDLIFERLGNICPPFPQAMLIFVQITAPTRHCIAEGVREWTLDANEIDQEVAIASFSASVSTGWNSNA